MIGVAFTGFAVLLAFGTWFYGWSAGHFGAALMTCIHFLSIALAFTSLALSPGSVSIWVAFGGIGLTAGTNTVLSGTL